MTYTILFIITLVLVSGFVAYFGDLIGRKMGKRRLTLFGLRPRHTAIIVTTITGMLIAVITMGTMMAFSSTLRRVLIAGERMIVRNQELSEQNRALTATNTALRDESSELRQQRAGLETQLTERIKEHGRAIADLDAAKSARDKAVAARDEARQRVDQLSASIERNLQELEDLQKRREINEQQLDDLGRQLALNRQELEERKKELALRQADLSQAQSHVAEALQRLTLVRQEVEESSRQILAQAITIRQQSETIDAQRDQILEQVRILEVQDWEGARIAHWYTSMREGEIRFRQGEELTRRVVEPGQYRVVRSKLNDLLDDVSEFALSRGAAVGVNGRAVRLISVDPESRLVENDEQECLHHWAESIARSSEDVMVQVVASGNILENEQAVIEFRSYYNKVAFIRGETVARTKAPIDGSMSEGRILVDVVKFLQDEVREAASKAGVVPVANDEPQIKDEQLDELLALVERIRAVKGPVSIRAVAEKDIRRAGPIDLMNMSFTVSPAVVQDKQAG